LAFVDYNVLPEPALHVRIAHGAAHEAHVKALVALTGSAVPTFVAGLARVHSDLSAKGDKRDFAPGLLDRAGYLMP
jgi:hypothetical protein